MIPETQRVHNDGIDLLVDACKTFEMVKNVDGSLSQELILDPEKAWWKTHIVNSPTFARFAFELKEFERLGIEAKYNMSPQRAQVLGEQILMIGKDWRYSIDAKSSESLRDKHNTQQTLLDKVQRNKIEKAYTLKGEAKRSMLDGFMHRDAAREDED